MGEDKELNLVLLNTASGGYDDDTETDAVIWLRHLFEKYRRMGFTIDQAGGAIASESDKPKYWRSFIDQIAEEVYSDGYNYRFYQ